MFPRLVSIKLVSMTIFARAGYVGRVLDGQFFRCDECKEHLYNAAVAAMLPLTRALCVGH